MGWKGMIEYWEEGNGKNRRRRMEDEIRSEEEEEYSIRYNI
jgi:hypothetical protein